MSSSTSDDTLELPVAGTCGDETEVQPISPVVSVDVAGLTHPGNVRRDNEDHFLVCRFGRFLERLQTNLPEGDVPPRVQEGGYALMVADGIGGSAAGEWASRLAIRTLIELVLKVPDWILRAEDHSFREEVWRRAGEYFGQINAALAQQAQGDPGLRGFGTTLTVAWNLGPALFVAHLGDSRAYLFRQGQLHRLTRDHTLAQQMADRGLLAQSEAASHHLRHVLLKALGDTACAAEPDVRRFVLTDGDGLLLCSDGLTDMVAESAITGILLREQTANETCQHLVDAALQAGGKDNVTAIVARYRLSLIQ
jgi:protein phosphatase